MLTMKTGTINIPEPTNVNRIWQLKVTTYHNCYDETFGKLTITLWHPGGFGDFWEKKRLNARGFAWDFLWSSMLYKPDKVSKDVASLLVCTRKNFFAWGCRFFVSDVISGGLLGQLGPLCLALGANC